MPISHKSDEDDQEQTVLNTAARAGTSNDTDADGIAIVEKTMFDTPTNKGTNEQEQINNYPLHNSSNSVQKKLYVLSYQERER